MTNKVTIIVAGVVGVATALTLQPRCHKVFLLDRERPCSCLLYPFDAAHEEDNVGLSGPRSMQKKKTTKKKKKT